jgi:hypothetical protein
LQQAEVQVTDMCPLVFEIPSIGFEELGTAFENSIIAAYSRRKFWVESAKRSGFQGLKDRLCTLRDLHSI